MAREILGVRAYARRRGVSHVAVLKAIETGRISAALVAVEGGKKIDAEAADRLWDANTDLSAKRAPSLAGVATAPSELGLFGPLEAPAETIVPDDVLPRPGTFAAARADREAWAARMAQARYEALRGELVPLSRIRDLWARQTRSTRDALLSLPNRVAPDLAAETDPDAIERRLYEEIELALSNLADDSPT